MIELCSEYLSARYIWLYVFVISRTRFRVNPHSKLPECQGTPCNWQSLNLQISQSKLVSECSHLTFRFRACFKQGVLSHSGNYGLWIHSEARTWHDKNIQLKKVIFAIYSLSIYFSLLLDYTSSISPEKNRLVRMKKFTKNVVFDLSFWLLEIIWCNLKVLGINIFLSRWHIHV